MVGDRVSCEEKLEYNRSIQQLMGKEIKDYHNLEKITRKGTRIMQVAVTKKRKNVH